MHMKTPILSAWASEVPRIDGQLDPAMVLLGFPYPGEWEDADRVDFVLSWEEESHDVSLYVMNDNINLYLAIEIYDEDWHWDDRVVFNFDNDHDGNQSAGDNHLSVIGWNFFQDAYFPSLGVPLDDINDGVSPGVNDGVGATQFTGETSGSGTHVFEVAYPLNSSDDLHDFSLKIGDVVGFNVLYLDRNGFLGSDGWPTYTWDNWSEMADVRIAGPPIPPPLSAADLTISSVEITQDIQFLNNSLPLVCGKTTVARVYVDIGPRGPSRSVTVYLYGLDVDGFSLGTPLSQSFEAPFRYNLNRDRTTHSANFYLPTDWINRASPDCLTLKGFVRASSPLQAETDYANNWIGEQSFFFSERAVPTIYIVPVNMGTRAAPNIVSDEEITRQEEYLRTVYPVPDVNFIRLSWELVGENAPAASGDLNRLLTDVGYDFGLEDGGIDLIYGFTPTGGGLSRGEGRIAASGYRGSSREATMAHELNHNLGPRYEWGSHVPGGCGELDPMDEVWPHPDGTIQETGFDTRELEAVSASTPELMTYCQAPSGPTKWISPYRWRNLFSRFSPAGLASVEAIQQEGESLLVSGWISQNRTASLDPVFRLPGTRESLSTPGTYSIVLQDTAGIPVFTKTFDLLWINEGVVEDPYYFTMLLPDFPTVAQISIVNETEILDTIIMTPSAPNIQVISPNGGELWDSGIQTIQWEGQDPDSDTLTYRLYYSADYGATWTLLATRIKDTSYAVDASALPGGSLSLIRVVASDGFHTISDQSDSTFTVMQKAPEVASIGVGPCMTYNYGDPVILKCWGFDPEDGELPDTSFSWDSDHNGPLGTGRELTITHLNPGVHNITVTVTDSHGNNATDSFAVTVELHNIAVTNVALTKTVVGQGHSINLTITVQNKGNTLETFNVTFYSTDTCGSTEPATHGEAVTDVMGGSSTTITMMWNTSLYEKGNYTVSAQTIPVQGETYTADNVLTDGWAIIAMVGDITGPDGWPDGKCDMRDVGLVARYFGETVPPAQANCDLTGPTTGVPDGKIDMRDIGLVARHFGEIDP